MAIRMKTSVTLKASGQGKSHALTDISVRNLVFPIDEPEARGGTNLGPTPTETAIAALMGCTNVIGNKCAESIGVDIGNLRMEASCEFDRRGVTLAEEIDVPFTSVRLDVYADGAASAEQLEHVGNETDKYCPLAKLFNAAGTKLVVQWHKE